MFVNCVQQDDTASQRVQVAVIAVRVDSATRIGLPVTIVAQDATRMLLRLRHFVMAFAPLANLPPPDRRLARGALQVACNPQLEEVVACLAPKGDFQDGFKMVQLVPCVRQASGP